MAIGNDDLDEDPRERLLLRVERLEALLETLENRLLLAKKERTRAALEPVLADVQKQYARALNQLL